jgi:hypothetical protein
MKLVITPILISTTGEPRVYPVEGNKLIEYDKPVSFAVNGILAKTLQKGEQAKVLAVVTRKKDGTEDANLKRFTDELDAINKDIGARIQVESIKIPFEWTSDSFERVFRELVGRMECNAEVLADITYGSKPLALIIFAALQFAEKFYDARISHLVYSKVEFGQGNQIIPGSAMIYDMTPLYHLCGITAVMEADSPAQALHVLDRLYRPISEDA